MLAGAVKDTEADDRHFGWGVSYLQNLGDHVAVGWTYLNEGHTQAGRRDGHSPQLWLRTDVGKRVTLAAGVGPYVHFASGSKNRDSHASHGLGAVCTLTATLRIKDRFLFQLRGNWIDGANDFNTYSLMTGIGYELEPRSGEKRAARPHEEKVDGTRNELTFMAGEAVLNHSHEGRLAGGLEYRRSIWPHLDVTTQFLVENPNGDNRYGVAAQLWAVNSAFDERLVFGVGLGPYLAYDKSRGNRGSTTVNVLIGLTAGYVLEESLLVRLLWHRVATNYHRDADLFLAGLGYRF